MLSQKSHYVTDWLAKRAKLTPERIAFQDTMSGREITYAEWNKQTNRTANFLLSLGVEKGDRVSVYSSNRVEYLDILFACGKIGAILHNLNWRLTVVELQGILADAEPKVLIYSLEWQENINELRAQSAFVEHFIVMDEPAKSGDKSFSERESYSPILSAHPDLKLDDPWGIYYTGGTTGLPKGAIMTHGNMTWNSINTVVSWE